MDLMEDKDQTPTLFDPDLAENDKPFDDPKRSPRPQKLVRRSEKDGKSHEKINDERIKG